MVETQEKRLHGLVLISIVALSLFGGAALYMSYELTLGKPSEKDTILVTGTGSVIVSPDIATFVAMIVTNATNVAQAAELNTKSMNRIVSALKNATLFYRVDVNTDYYFTNQVYQSGYQATRGLVVITEDIYALDRLVDVALSNGATSVSQFSYDLSKTKREQVDAEATRLAFDNAYKKAKQMADNMGVQLGRPTLASISVHTSEAGPSAAQSAAGQIEYVVDVEVSYTFT
jgi:uncharacterized protein YggE